MDTTPIRTERLLLRPWRVADAPAVRDALDASDAHLRPWIPFMKREPQDLAGTRAWVQARIDWFAAGTHYCYGVFLPDAGTLLGEVMLLGRGGEDAPDTKQLEIGYWIDVRHVGHGYATEAAEAMVARGFGPHACDRLTMVCDPRNIASIRVPTKLGFELARTEPGGFTDNDGIPRDAATYALDRPSAAPGT